MIAQKNLQYLNEILTQEKTHDAKMGFYAEQIKEPQLKTIAKNLQTMHQKNYDAVYAYLKSHKQS